MRILIAMFILIAACAVADAASAKPDHAKHKGGKSAHSDYRGGGHDDDKVLISLGDDRVHSIADRLRPYYAKKCPPGLAKKHNGCLPPGHAHGYRVGAPLPGGYWPVPDDVVVLLPRAPYGAKYVWVDKDILLISEATKKVLDAAVILSGIN